MTQIKKAVFPVAGFGTRFLPATKAMPKEMLPIVDKPLIQYAAEEAIAAGIETLVFITGRNKRAIEDHFDSNQELEAALTAKGKYVQADMVHSILPSNVECIYVRQPVQLGLGHAILCAQRAVGNEPFAVLLPDDFMVQKGNGVMADLVQAFERTQKSQLSTMQVQGENLSKYGVLRLGNRPNTVAGVVEKPSLADAPSDMASVGRYVLTPDIFDILSNQGVGAGDEIQLADAINTQAAAGGVRAVPLNGLRFDCGSVAGYVAAIQHMAISSGYLAA